YNKLLTRISQDAYACFESKLAEREEPGRQIGSVRALFDLWVDAAEDAWAKAALSQDYRRVFAELTNAQMQLRGAVQAQAEQAATALGLPGRTELDSAHRKIAELERQLRRMQRDAAPPTSTPAQANATPAPAKPAATKSAAVKKKPVANKAAPEPAANKSVAARAPVKAAAASKASKRKTPVKPTKPVARKR
ncbi:MAG TPA: poly(R)-hydroxyalkanoic acid synthase subunit PhaE, partial [Thermomonas sp.]|nr:poly(R)-hydroxyalkanoic acid synthase subunit PhaE [Thermomonas sp.]